MLKNRRLQIMIVLFLLMLLAVAVGPSYASLLDEKLQERDELENQLSNVASTIQQQRNREAALRQELDQLERRINTLQAELARLSREIDATEVEIDAAEAELAKAEEELEYQENLLKSRLRAIHERGTVTYLEVLLGATTFSDFLTRLSNLQVIVASDMRLVEEIEAERKRIQGIKENLEERKNELEGMRRQTLANQGEVERVAQTRERVLVDLRAAIASNLAMERELELQSQALEKEIARLLIDDGQLPPVRLPLQWPMEPNYWISSSFGWRNNPFNPRERVWHGGIDIVPQFSRANYILAAETGVVIKAEWWAGYGFCIMIQHHGGYVTLYAHLSRIDVSQGQTVYRRDPIGRAGTTGNSTGVHLHFEVRKVAPYFGPYRYYPSGTPDHRYPPMDYLR